MKLLSTAMALASGAQALFQCNNIQVNGKKYDLSKFDRTYAISDVQNTPPSFTNMTWYINPCSELPVAGCPEKSQICGLETVELNGKSDITRIIPISSDGSQVSRSQQALENGQGVKLIYEGSKWGDEAVSAELIYECSETEELFEHRWEHSRLQVRFKSPNACISGAGDGNGGNNGDNKDGNNGDNKDGEQKDTSSHWGFFKTIFWFLIFAVVVYFGLTIYLNMQNAPFEGQIADLMRDLPYLIKDLVRKVTDTFSGGQRGYSAV